MKFLFLLLFSMSSYAQYDCKVIEVKKGDAESISTELCFNKRVDSIYSPECKDKNCEVYETIDNNNELVESLDYGFEFGNPTIYVCTQFGNIAETVELTVNGKPHLITWCRKGESIVDAGSFFMHFKEAQRK